MQVKCVCSLNNAAWQDRPFDMAAKMALELQDFLEKNIQLDEKTEFVKAVGSFHDLNGNLIGEIVLEDDDE